MSSASPTRALGVQFVVGIHAVLGLPYDRHTLREQIASVERLAGVAAMRVYVGRLSRPLYRSTFISRKARLYER
jgi:hypothetical protein